MLDDAEILHILLLIQRSVAIDIALGEQGGYPFLQDLDGKTRAFWISRYIQRVITHARFGDIGAIYGGR